MEGGYYAYEIAPKLVLISINGMYPFLDNESDLAQAEIMINWVGELLSNITSEGKYFMIETHIWPGLHYFKGLE